MLSSHIVPDDIVLNCNSHYSSSISMNEILAPYLETEYEPPFAHY